MALTDEQVEEMASEILEQILLEAVMDLSLQDTLRVWDRLTPSLVDQRAALIADIERIDRSEFDERDADERAKNYRYYIRRDAWPSGGEQEVSRNEYLLEQAHVLVAEHLNARGRVLPKDFSGKGIHGRVGLEQS